MEGPTRHSLRRCWRWRVLHDCYTTVLYDCHTMPVAQVLEMEVVHHEASHYLLRWWPSALRPEHSRLKDEVEALKV